MAKKKLFRTDKKSDSARKAKPSGYRYDVGNDKEHPLYYKRPTANEIKKHLAGDAKWKDKIYYEARPERGDLNQTKKLEKGGDVGSKVNYASIRSAIKKAVNGKYDNTTEKSGLIKLDMSYDGEVLDFTFYYNEEHYADFYWDKIYKNTSGELTSYTDNKQLIEKTKKALNELDYKVSKITGDGYEDDDNEEMKEGGSLKQTKKGIKQDKNIKAKKAGKRTSAEGNTYFESRPNRSDKNLTKKLEKGGEMDKFYKVSINKNMEAEFLSILKENNITDYTFIGYENQEGLEVAVYDVYVKSMDELEIIKRNSETLAPQFKEGGSLWIQVATEHKGALRRKAKEMGLIHGDETLSESDLDKIEALGGVWNKRVELARTLKGFHKEEGGDLDNSMLEKGGELKNGDWVGVKVGNIIYNGEVFDNSKHSIGVILQSSGQKKYVDRSSVSANHKDFDKREIKELDLSKMSNEELIINELNDNDGKVKTSFLRNLLGGRDLDYTEKIGNIKLRKPHLHSYYVQEK